MFGYNVPFLMQVAASSKACPCAAKFKFCNVGLGVLFIFTYMYLFMRVDPTCLWEVRFSLPPPNPAPSSVCLGDGFFH